MSKSKTRPKCATEKVHSDQQVKPKLERNQVLYSTITRQYYFVPVAQRLGAAGMLRVKGKKINVTSSVWPLVAHAVATQLRKMARSSKIYPSEKYNLLNEANKVEKEAGISEELRAEPHGVQLCAHCRRPKHAGAC